MYTLYLCNKTTFGSDDKKQNQINICYNINIYGQGEEAACECRGSGLSWPEVSAHRWQVKEVLTWAGGMTEDGVGFPIGIRS